MTGPACNMYVLVGKATRRAGCTSTAQAKGLDYAYLQSMALNVAVIELARAFLPGSGRAS